MHYRGPPIHPLGRGVAGRSCPRDRARLSGALIGIELVAATPYWLGQEVAIIGASALARTYETALQAQGVTARSHDVTEKARAGLAAARTLLEETAP